MRQPSINIYSIISKWRDALASDTAIKSFCQDKYGKDPVIFVGLDSKSPPNAEASCPYIIIFGGSKVEGLIDEYQYNLSLGWNIYRMGKEEDIPVVECLGIGETCQMAELIKDCIGNVDTAYPVVHWEVSTDVDVAYPQYPGVASATITVPFTIGASMVY